MMSFAQHGFQTMLNGIPFNQRLAETKPHMRQLPATLNLSLLLLLGPFLSNCWGAPSDFPPKADFYVSTDGSDDWSGSLPQSNAQGKDGPFASLARARDAVRELKQDSPDGGVVVLIREGLYRLSETVVFGPRDSGTGDAAVTYAAYPGERPVFSSGRQIRGWKRVPATFPGLPETARGNVWVADVPKIDGAAWRFYTLYDPKGMLPRARSAGFIPPKDGGRDTLHFPQGRLRNWPNLEDVEIVIRPLHAWIVNILPLASVDEKARIARTAIPATYAMKRLRFLRDTPSCWVENVLEALDAPGEWVLNTREGKLYLWPRGEGAPQGLVVPRLRELVRVEGVVDKKAPKDVPARNLRFRGLTFMHGERYLLTEDDAGLQHDWDMHDRDHALFRLRGAENCAIEDCHFAHSGGGAIRIDLHGKENRISGNHIEHIGGTGILLCGYGPGTKDVNRKNRIVNNHIHHTGRIYSHSPGIFIWQSGENRVANNLIHHTPYSALIVSGCMARFFARPDARELVRTIRWHEIGAGRRRKTPEQVRSFLHTHDNLIEYNEIHHAMEQLGDGNGVYVRGAGAGNVIRRNYIHHLVAPTRMQSAIRTDGGQRDTLIAENLIYKCASQGIKLKLNNRAENNIIADIIRCRAYVALREGPMTGATLKRNILYHPSGKRCTFIDQDRKGTRGRKPALMKDIDADHNLYYCVGNRRESRKALVANQRDGVDAHSLAVDPLFADPSKGDFRLQPGSPAAKLGFVPIDVSKMGLRDTQDINSQQSPAGDNLKCAPAE